MALVTAATLGGTLLGSTFLASAAAFAINTAIGAVASFALSTVTAAIAGKPKSPIPSVRTRVAFGGDVPRSFILGRGATAGSFVWGNTWGQSGKVPNAYLTQVFALSDLPVAGLRKVFVNGEAVTLGATPDPDGKGYPVEEYRWKGQPHLWVKFHDGTQTAADDFLVNTASSADRPWQGTRVGVGVAYAITTARFRAELFQGAPSFRFELDGIELPDATTLADAADRRVNPVAQMLALMKGLSHGGQPFYGCQGFTAAQFPAADWAAAAVKARDAGFEAGGEIEVSTPVGDVLEALLASCQGRMCDDAGVSYRPVVGLPGPSIASFDDDDIISTSPQSFTPFQGLADAINGVVATYASPSQNWNARTAPPLYVADLEAEDGGRRLPVALDLPLVYRDEQVQRLMKAALKEARRARRHTLTLPPGYKGVRVGDRIAWTSARNGYAAKAFRVDGLVRQGDLDVLIEITEIDPADYDWDGATDFAPVADGFIGAARPPEQSTSISVAPHTITVAGEPRRPAIRLIWTGAPEDADALAWQVRVKASGDLVSDGVVDVEPNDDGETILSAGVTPLTQYELRGRWVPRPARPVAWSAWLTVTTPDVRLTDADIADAILTTAKFAAGIEPVGLVSALPSPVGYGGPSIVFHTVEGKLYRHVSGAWVRDIPTADLSGTIAEAQIATNAVTAAKIAVGAIDGTKLQDAIVSNAKLVNGAVDAAKIATGAITAVKLGDGAVSELKLAAAAVTGAKIATGAIDGTKIASGAVTAAKLGAAAVDATKLASGAVTAASIAAGAVIAGKIAAGAVSATEIAAGAVVAGKIAANAVTATEIAANAVVADKIAAGAVTSAKITAGAIDATKIAAGAVLADKIGANAVTAAKIAAGAVDAAKIAVGAVTAEKIQAGAVATDKIAANAVTASKLVVADLANIWPDYDHEDPGLLTTAPSAYKRFATAVSTRGRHGVEVYADAAARDVYSVWLPIEPSVDYFTEVSAACSDASARLYVQVGSLDASANVTYRTQFLVAQRDASTSTTRIQGAFTTASTDRRYRIRYHRTGGGTGSAVFGGVTIRRKASGALIVDGSVTAGKIAANAVTADKISAGSVVAGKIAAGAVSATEIAANAITSAKIAADAVTADKINVSSLSAISANLGTISVGSANIANASVSTLKIAGSAVDSDRLASAAVSEYTRVVNGTDYSTFSSALTTLRSYSVPAGFIIIPRLYARWKTAISNDDGVELFVKVGSNTVFSYAGGSGMDDNNVFRTDDVRSLSYYLPSPTTIVFQARKTSKAQTGRQVILDYHIVECVVLKK